MLATMTSFAIAIDQTSGTPPFRQLHNAVIAAVASGELAPGSRLPTVRGLATDLGLAANTVASAYRALEEAGVVEGRGRAGTFVTLGDDPIQARARELAHSTARALVELGVGRERAIALIGEAFDALTPAGEE